MKSAHRIAADVKQYRQDMKGLYKTVDMGISSKVINHIYEWAKLNDSSDNSRQNWHNLMRGELKDTIKDEGSLFKEITMTVDLMKQMCDICDTGRLYSNERKMDVE